MLNIYMGVYILRIYMNICVAIFCCKLKNSLKLKRFSILPPAFSNYVRCFMFLLIRFVYTQLHVRNKCIHSFMYTSSI